MTKSKLKIILSISPLNPPEGGTFGVLSFWSGVRDHKKSILWLIVIAIITIPLIANASSINIGEKLLYDVKFIGIKGVDVTFQVKGIENVPGKGAVEEVPTYHIAVTAKTNDFFTKFVYKVDNLYEVFVDTTTFQPRLFRKQIRQGKEDNYDREVYSWHERNIAYYDDNFAIKLPDNCYELFSAVYYLRQKAPDMALGDTLALNALSDKILWTLDLVAEEKETLEINDKEYQTIRYKFLFNTDASEEKLENRPPDLYLKNIFDNGGLSYLWLSDDEDRLPVKADFKKSSYHLILSLKEVVNTPKMTSINNEKNNPSDEKKPVVE